MEALKLFVLFTTLYLVVSLPVIDKYYPRNFKDFRLLDWLWWISLYVLFITVFVF